MSVRVAVSAFAHRGARRSQALELAAYSGGVVVLLVLLAAWIVEQARTAPLVPSAAYIPWSVLGLADLFAATLVGLGLFVLAPAAVAATVAGERRTGTLDQLRSTPLDPLGLVAGLVVGAPARIYLLCAGPLALHVACGLTGVIPAETLVQSLAVFAVGGLGSALVGLVVALAPRQESGGAFLALGVAALLGVSGLVALAFAHDTSTAGWAFLHPAGALDAAFLQHDGLWRRLSTSEWSLRRYEGAKYLAALSLAPVATVAAYLPAIFLLGRAACRKLSAPHLPLLSKGQSLALFTLVAASVMLPLDAGGLGRYHVANMPLGFGLALLPFYCAFGLFATPSFESWVLGLRGRIARKPWHDEAAPHALAWAMVAVFFGLCVLELGAFPLRMYERELVSLGFALATAATLPIYMLFANTRYTTTAPRWAFGAAVGAHLIFQLVTITILHDDGFRDGTAGTVAKLGVALALAVPAWVLYRQRALRRRTLGNN
jgi:hypothetical protein